MRTRHSVRATLFGCEEAHGIDTADNRAPVSGWSIAHMAVQHWLGILPKRRPGADPDHPADSAFNGQALTGKS